MAVLKVRDPADSTGQTWITLPSTGPTGPTGPAGDGGLPLTGGTIAGDVVVNGALSTNGNYVNVNGDGYGVIFHGGARLYKASGSGLVFRKHAPSTNLQIEESDGSSRRNILDTTNIQGTTYNISWMNSWKGACDIRVNPAMVSIRFFQVTRGITQDAYAESQMFVLPAGVPVPPGQIIVPATLRESDWTSYPGVAYLDVRTNGQVWCRMTEDGLVADARYIEQLITWAR